MKYLISTPMQLSHALRDVRKSHGLSQEAAGALVGLLPKTVSSLENHPERASVESLLKLLSALGLEVQISAKNDSDSELPVTANEDW